MAETWIQSTARNLVFQILKRIEHGRLTISTKYENGKNESLSFGGDGADSEAEIVVIVKNPQVFVRLCQAFDLVRGPRILYMYGDQLLTILKGPVRVVHGPRRRV
jgi:hypothetical protein